MTGAVSGRDCIVVRFTTTYAISAYHHWCCEVESGQNVQHYVINFVSDLQQVGGFLEVLRFSPPTNRLPWYNWNIVESGTKHHQTSIYIYIYIIYVWKLNQTVLELDFKAVKFLFFPRRDLNPHHCYTAAPFA
jgi:hypothetical protein